MSRASGILALILAAGQSSRMERFKPLAPLGHSTFIEECIGAFRMAGVQDVRVAVGHRARELTPVVERMGARPIQNPDPGRGMFSSVLAGVASFEPEVRAFFLLPADMPLIRPRTIRTLLETYGDGPERIIHPRFLGKRGHPPLIPVAFIPKDLSSDFPGGMRSLLKMRETDAVDVDVADEGILVDCDTLSDYERVLRRWLQAGIPTEAECDAIGVLFQTPSRVVAHGVLVGEVAAALAARLNQAGHSLDVALVRAAGRLHDIARERADHARAGAALLEELGFPRLAALVAQHTSLSVGDAGVTEAELLYLADKCVEDDRVVSLEERFGRAMSRWAGRVDILREITKRMDDARIIADRVERGIGAPLSKVLRHEMRNPVPAQAPR